LSYGDFDPLLSPFSEYIECFGTVGVGYVWNLTLKSSDHIDVVLAATDNGNYFVKQVIPIFLSKSTEVLQSATLFWLPYWVSNDHVASVLSNLIGSKVSCTYIRIPQGSLQGCYTTQRRLVCPAGFAKAPHFVNILFETESYRCHVFVPGRPPVCFACGLEGHMRNRCEASIGGTKPLTQSTVQDQPEDCPVETAPSPFLNRIRALADSDSDDGSSTPNSPIHNRSKLWDEDAKDGSSHAEQQARALGVSPHLGKLFQAVTDELQAVPPPSQKYAVIYNPSKDFLKSHNGNRIEVCPPGVDVSSNEELIKASKRCAEKRCGWLTLWSQKKICLDTMEYHFRHDPHIGLFCLDKV
jgi:hypothetical protein